MRQLHWKNVKKKKREREKIKPKKKKIYFYCTKKKKIPQKTFKYIFFFFKTSIFIEKRIVEAFNQ